jgi:hypothetical protein
MFEQIIQPALRAPVPILSSCATSDSLTTLQPFLSHSRFICVHIFMLLSNMLWSIGVSFPGNCMCHVQHSLLYVTSSNVSGILSSMQIVDLACASLSLCQPSSGWRGWHRSSIIILYSVYTQYTSAHTRTFLSSSVPHPTRCARAINACTCVTCSELVLYTILYIPHTL